MSMSMSKAIIPITSITSITATSTTTIINSVEKATLDYGNVIKNIFEQSNKSIVKKAIRLLEKRNLNNNQIDNNDSLNDSFNEYKILRLNALQPNRYDVKALRTCKDYLNFTKEATPISWYKAIPLESLFCVNKIGNKRKLLDQMKRANILVDMLTDDHTEIVTMDGHGRFVRCLIQALALNEKKAHLIDKIKIILVDNFLDKYGKPIVSMWHRKFLPQSIVTSVYGNIYSYKPSNNRLVYLNFCGLGGAEGAVNFINYMNNIKTTESLMMSISTAQRGKHTLDYIENPIKYLEKLNNVMKLVEKKVMKEDNKTNNEQLSITNKYKSKVINEPENKVTNEPENKVINEPENKVTNEPENKVENKVANEPINNFIKNYKLELKTDRTEFPTFIVNINNSYLAN